MENNIIRFNSYKLERGGLLYDMYDQFNARVGDQGTPLVMQWTQGLADTLIDLQAKKLHFYAAGQVGQYLEKLKDGTGYQMSADASQVEYEDRNAAGTMDHGITKVKLPKQFFPQEGIFYGYFGLKDDQGNTYTSVNVWFRVLGGVPIMGAAIPYFSTRFDELMETCQGRIEDVLIQLQKEIQGKIQSAENAIDDNIASLKKLASAVGAIQAQIVAGNVVTLVQHNRDIKSVSNMITEKLAQMSMIPEAFENLDSLKQTYPSGKTGIMITIDTGHKWIWFNNQWNDCGVYQSSAIWDKNVTIIHAEDLKPPYDDANEYPANSTVTIAVDPSLIQNIPQKTSFTMITMSANSDLTGAVQFFIPQSGRDAYYRIAWQLPHIYTRWISLNSDGNNTQVFTSKLNDSNKDLSKLPANSTITYAVDDNSKLVGVPDTVDGPFTITTQASSNEGLGGAYQLLITQNLSIFMRLAWGDPPTFSEWISIGRNSFNKQIFNSNLTDAYQNLNKLKVNTTVTYACDIYKVANVPAGENSAFTIRTINAIDDNAAGAVQLLFSQAGNAYWRLGWGVPAVYDKWKKFYPTDAPQPVTNSTINPSLAMFPTFTVIGDSYTCGTTDFDNNWKGSSKISWPQIMAREHGMSYKDSYSKGGATVTSFLQEHESTFNADDNQDLYIIELGINDALYYQDHADYLGTLDETDNDKTDHFYWYYAHIIKMIKAKAPNAKIICLGVTDGYNSGNNFTTITKAIQDIADKYGIPFVDIAQHPLFKSDFYTTHMVGGHPTGPVYAAMADAYTKLIQNCIVNNYDYFERYGAE